MPYTKTVANEPRNASSNFALSMKLHRKADFEKALIRQYAKAIKLSREAGHQVSFLVIVDPLAGAQTISVVEEEPQSHQAAFPVEEVPEPDGELQAALTAERERGRRRVAELDRSVTELLG